MNERLLLLCGVGVAGVACATVAVSRVSAEPKAAPVTVSDATPLGKTVAAPPPGKTVATPPSKTVPAAVPVLVELFTSEGCSSCPPADAVLAALERSQSVAGARIVPLALHVDYWDGIGWPDPFSSAQATQRQRSYTSLGSGPYTPQAVIDGRAEANGSRQAMVERAIGEAAKRAHAPIAIDVRAPKAAGAPAEVTLRVGALPAGAAADAEVLFALTQNAVRVDVPRGENAGKTLEHTAVLRQLVVVGPAPAAGADLGTRLTLPDGTPAKELRIVAFVLERGSRRVLGTATRDLVER
jgi:hypothetical protein